MPAPFVASAETNPRSIRSIRTGDEAGLDHVRAEAPDDAAIRRARGANRRDDRLEIRRGEDARQRVEQRPEAAAGAIRRARSPPRSPCSSATPADTCGRPTDRTLRRGISRHEDSNSRDSGSSGFGRESAARDSRTRQRDPSIGRSQLATGEPRLLGRSSRQADSWSGYESASHRRSCRTGTAAATASRYAASTRSRPANAATSISSDDAGRWKFVSSPSTTWKRWPG